jgi:NAD+ synthase
MPEEITNIKTATTKYLRQLHVEPEIIPIKSILDIYLRRGGIKDDPLVKGNLKARIRMCLLYSRSNADDLVVMGTGNRSELLAGYFTRYGDGGVDYLPIGELYKTQVWDLATYMGVPEEIVAQAPSADLWPGQTDEQELGISYRKLDMILFEGTEKEVSFNQMSIPGITKTEIEQVKTLVENNRFKSIVSPICHLKK